MKENLVSVVVVNWNHRGYLKTCLDALLRQDYPHIEVVVVDNASEDGSQDWVRAHFPQAQLLALTDNTGFTGGFNRGAAASQGEFVLSLNPDVEVEPGFVRELAAAARQDDRIGIVAPKLLRADDHQILDSTGLFINRYRRSYDRGQGETDTGAYDQKTEIFGACGAAALYRRAMLEDLSLANGEYFDDDFFAYYEDADLAWRAQSRGWKAVFAPLATGYHVRGWGDTLRKGKTPVAGGPRLALRNRYLMALKNDRLVDFAIDLPLILASEIPRLAYAVFARPEVWLGLVDLVKMAPAALRKRQQIRSQQTVADASVRRWFTPTRRVALQEAWRMGRFI